MRAGCHVEVPREIAERAAISVRTTDNACFAWSVVAALHPADEHVYRESSYPHYTAVLNLAGIEFPMILKDINKFEQLNDMSINVYGIENKQILPLRLTSDKKEKHINLLYLQDPRDDNVGHFAWIKNLSRLVRSQVTRMEHKKFFCDRCLHYFSTSEKLELHAIDCGKINNCAIRLPSEDDRWLEFNNHCNKKCVSFIVYADLECVLRKTEPDKEDASSYTYQQHEECRKSEHCQISTGVINSSIARIAQLEGMRNTLRQRFAHASTSHAHNQSEKSGLLWLEIETAFKRRVLTGVILNSNYIEPQQFLNDARDIVFEQIRDNLQRHICLKVNTIFNDSFKFLNTSLEKLVSYLDKSKLKIMRSEFLNLNTEDFDLLTRKGVFPYEYIDNVDKLNETSLPPREAFYSSLTGESISDDDFQHATNVWQRFCIDTLGDYSDLYLKIDVLLLADVFENFRDTCIKSYGLDPAHYYTLPGYTWDAMLKYTDIRFELLTDIDMVMFVERGIRGGLSQCSYRYARANNKYAPSYDPSKPSTYLMYFDVNNLYGWAMSQFLPYGEFQWVDNVEHFNVMSVSSDSVIGYILEVDLVYPQNYHDAHTDLPFCPTRERLPGKRNNKHSATLYDKERYVIHYRNLQQCIQHGLHVKKIYRILQFTQSPWLRGYIELNTRFRMFANNEFEKNLYKLMNNAVFGKTMENVREHVDVRLVTRWDGRYGAEVMISKPNFHSRSVFSEELVAVELRKLEVQLNKPIYVGMCILEISKIRLYEFHYEYIMPLYPDKCKILYTDTDSLIYLLEYLMKDENNGEMMTEFIGLRAKMYALKVIGSSDKKRIKGVKKNIVAKPITFDDYMRCLNDVI
ncbi:PREDICTED: uncharacterized protein LOC108762616 [Trachymyrmex cornetzi]|uniref:uncharacterized protein LOC108762616 n=1 Tax=Trachymyrmex cornetzi TaxID=471704 RepID=UPI00084F6DA6|nr:PREDICTED: uncharacterized protein LOC108762616 [Trachymyrmex cornetzi]